MGYVTTPHARIDRMKYVIREHSKGRTFRAIAAELGLTHQRVGQIWKDGVGLALKGRSRRKLRELAGEIRDASYRTGMRGKLWRAGLIGK